MSLHTLTTLSQRDVGQPRIWELPTCSDMRCNGHGMCVNETACECVLGYTGEFCRDTVNEAVSIQLTLGVLGFICSFIILAFVCSKFRQKRKAQMRKATAAAKEALIRDGNDL